MEPTGPPLAPPVWIGAGLEQHAHHRRVPGARHDRGRVECEHRIVDVRPQLSMLLQQSPHFGRITSNERIVNCGIHYWHTNGIPSSVPLPSTCSAAARGQPDADPWPLLATTMWRASGRDFAMRSPNSGGVTGSYLPDTSSTGTRAVTGVLKSAATVAFGHSAHAARYSLTI